MKNLKSYQKCHRCRGRAGGIRGNPGESVKKSMRQKSMRQKSRSTQPIEMRLVEYGTWRKIINEGAPRMGTLLLLQIGLDLGFIAIVTVLLIERTKIKSHEDPRMSRGLQLLSSKIAILQDLMDRSESTAKQLTQLLEVKQQDVHETLEEVDRHLTRVQDSMEKSKNVARLFQDRIPHEEVIERKTAAKYIKAAKLAHQGISVDEIATQVDIPRGELDLIVKLNRHRLVSKDEENVWLGEDETQMMSQNASIASAENYGEEESSSVNDGIRSLPQKIPNVIFQATVPVPQQAAPVQATSVPAKTPGNSSTVGQTLIYSSYKRGSVLMENAQQIRPVVFKKIQAEFKY